MKTTKEETRMLAAKIQIAVEEIQSSIRYSPYDINLQDAFVKLNEVKAALVASNDTASLKDLVHKVGEIQKAIYIVWRSAGDRLNVKELNYVEGSLRSLMEILDLLTAKGKTGAEATETVRE